MKIIIQHLEDLQDAQGPPELYEAAATPGEEVAKETPAADGQVAGNAVETLVPEVHPSATSVVPPTPTPPQDRALELAGLQALMEQQKLREHAEPLHVTTPKVEINWSSHKKEGMRLKRLMEESPDGSKFPHMKEMWNGSAAESLASITYLSVYVPQDLPFKASLIFIMF